MAKILVILGTYDRASLISETLGSLNVNRKDHDVDLWIYDDCSPVNYLGSLAKHRFKVNNGKKNYWKVISKIYQDIRLADEYDFYFHIPDDVTLKDNFFDEAIRTWEAIDDDKKMCMNLLFDSERSGKTCWTGCKPEDFGDVWRTQWMDMIYMCKRSMFEALDFIVYPIPRDRWQNGNEHLGSGVGMQISKRLHGNGFGLYQAKNSLLIHGNHDSKMNYYSRLFTPLTNGESNP